MNKNEKIKWAKEYEKIKHDINISAHQDLKSTIIFSIMINRKYNKIHFDNEIRDKIVYIIGTGATLENDIKSLNKTDDIYIIAADGAIGALLRENIIPNLCISDLDSRENDLLIANELGIPILINSHGDNVDKIYRIFPKLTRITIATSQIEEIENVSLNFGFTDGDRAFYFAKAYKARNIKLLGMNFDNKISKFSKPMFKENKIASQRKMKKISIAKRLIKNHEFAKV